MGGNRFIVATIAIALSTIALVPTAAGTLLPDALSEQTPPGVWTSDNADWALGPEGDGFALEIETQDDGENFGGSAQVNMPAGTQIADFDDLSFEAYYEEGGCGGGSPRLSFAVDADGDGASDGNVWAHAGQPGSFDGCSLGVWQTHDMLDGEDRFVTLQLGGPGYGISQSEAHEVAGEDHEVLSVSIVWDSTWRFGPSVTYLTDICIDDYFLAQPGDEVLSALGLGCQ